METIHLRMSMAEMAFQHDDVIDDIEFAIRRFPECCEQLVPHVIRLMRSPIESVRAAAFGFALDIISQRPQTRCQLKEAYISTMQSNDFDITRQAITFLPDFVNICIANADELISAAMHCCTRRSCLNDVHDYVVEAMAVFGQSKSNDEDGQNSDKKDMKRRSREDGEIN
uniref:Adaptin_N domain-containing protein n=1 Tax=Haemonchus contortus TaxID=6289 RepID=A0A7I5EAB5_HAECO